MTTLTFNTRSWVKFANGAEKLFNNSNDANSYAIQQKTTINEVSPLFISEAKLKTQTAEDMMEDFNLGSSMGDPSPKPNNI